VRALGSLRGRGLQRNTGQPYQYNGSPDFATRRIVWIAVFRKVTRMRLAKWMKLVCDISEAHIWKG
jgi:hypothetical protein